MLHSGVSTSANSGEFELVSGQSFDGKGGPSKLKLGLEIRRMVAW